MARPKKADQTPSKNTPVSLSTEYVALIDGLRKHISNTTGVDVSRAAVVRAGLAALRDKLSK